jgi:hypothetical protein
MNRNDRPSPGAPGRGRAAHRGQDNKPPEHPYGGRLLPQHADKLRSSAVAPEVAAERGYVSIDKLARLERRGFARGQAGVPALLVPLFDVWGEAAGYQARPDDPRVGPDGRIVKYESPSGQRQILDVPPRCRPGVRDASVPLWVTEGPLKADALASAGAAAVIALAGVWGWRGATTGGATAALPDWELVPLKGRLVLLCFDSDAVYKPQVRLALERLAAFLGRRGATVRFVVLPDLDDGRKAGVDDHLAAGRTLAEVEGWAVEELPPPPESEAEPQEDPFADVPVEAGHVVLDDVEAALRRYVVLGEHEAVAVVLWCGHCWIVNHFVTTPRLVLQSPDRRCGKSRVFEVIAHLVPDAVHASSATPAYVVRRVEKVVDGEIVTLLLDEADAIFSARATSERSEELRSLINGGHRRGAVVGRCVGNGAELRPVEFSSFAPVALAGLGIDWCPATVRDRAVVIEMRRRLRWEAVERYSEARTPGELAPVGRRLGAWCRRNVEAIRDGEPDIPAALGDRQADCWEPLLRIAEAAGGEWPRRAREAAVALARTVETDPDDSVPLRFLADVRGVLEAAGGRAHLADIAQALNGIDDAPWAGRNRGAGISPRDVSRLARSFGVRAVNLRNRGVQKKGLRLEDFADAFGRYLPPADAEARAGILVPIGQQARAGRASPGGNPPAGSAAPPAGACRFCGVATALVDGEGPTCRRCAGGGLVEAWV